MVLIKMIRYNFFFEQLMVLMKMIKYNFFRQRNGGNETFFMSQIGESIILFSKCIE